MFADQDGHRFVVIAGKSTNYLGVGTINGPAGEKLYATKVERTLVDIAVRPIYCGGVGKVLEAHRTARDELSAKRLKGALERLDDVVSRDIGRNPLLIAACRGSRTRISHDLGNADHVTSAERQLKLRS